jgi:hypothetical protein
MAVGPAPAMAPGFGDAAGGEDFVAICDKLLISCSPND